MFIGLVAALTGIISALDYGDYQRISVSAEGTQGDAPSTYAMMSADGNLILFESYADNLTAEGEYGYFLYDREIDLLERLDIDPAQASFNQLRLSASGRYLLYETGAASTTTRRVWLRDLQTDTNEMVSVDTEGGEPNQGSAVLGLSADGRYAVFTSYATDLVASMAGCNQLFVRDTVNDTTVCVPMGAGQSLAHNFLTAAAALSEDGTKLYYGAPDPVCCSASELFVYDLGTQTTTPIDITFDDQPVTSGITLHDVSDNGTLATFTEPLSENIVSGVSGGHVFYMYDSTTSSITAWDAVEQGLVESAEDATYYTMPVTISSDNRYIWGELSRFVESFPMADSSQVIEIGSFNFVYDRQTDTTTLILATGSNPVTGDMTAIRDVSADGSVIVFSSEEATLVPDDTNGFSDIFLATLQSEPTVTELLVNGDFDDNDDADNLLPDGWKKVGLLKNDRVRSDTLTTTYAHSTPNAFQLQGTPDEVGVVSKLTRNAKISGLTFAKGDTLTFSAMVDQRSGIPGTPFAKALVKFNNGTQQPMTLKLPNPKISGYTSVSLSKPLKRGDVRSIRVDVFYGKSSGKLYLDDVSLTHTPVSSAPMLIPVPAAP